MKTPISTLLNILLPSSPFTEVWITVVASVLMLTGLLLLCFYPIYNGKRLFIKADGRKTLFEDNTQNNIWTLTLQSIFCLGTFSLLFYSLTRPESAEFRFLPYLHIMGCVCLFLVVKFIVIKVVGYVFFTPLQQNIYLLYHQHLFWMMCLILFPAILCYLYLPPHLSYWGLSLIILALLIGLIFLIVEIFQLFFHNLVAGFYILLYLCTLEILPYFGLFQWIGNEVWKV